MQLEWIHAFLAVVDRGGFTAASVHLYRSQGRVSSYIAALEREMGVQLFDRRQRPARLTAAGEAFVTHARAMVDDFVAGKAAVASVETMVRGDVTLATYPSAGAAYVPQVLRRFSEDYPGIRAELVEHAVHGIDLALDQGTALLAIRPTLPPPPGSLSVCSELLWCERMCLVVPAHHRLAASDVANVADFHGEPLVVSGNNLRYDTEAFRLLTSAGAEPTVAYLSDQPQTLVGLVGAGLALGFTNRLAMETARTDGVAVLDVSPPLFRQVGVYWTHALEASPAATALLETVRRTPAPPATSSCVGQSVDHPNSG